MIAIVGTLVFIAFALWFLYYGNSSRKHQPHH